MLGFVEDVLPELWAFLTQETPLVQSDVARGDE